MRRRIAIVLLALGAIAGFGAEAYHWSHGGHGCHARWHHGADG